MSDAPAGNLFQFELVSPERVLVSEEAKMVVVPGEEGDFGVLAQHAPLLSSLRPGVLVVHSPDGAVQKIFVSGGFADVTPEQCSVLAEEAVSLEDLAKPSEEDIRNLEDDLGFAKDEPVKAAHIQKQIAVAKAKIAALEEAA